MKINNKCSSVVFDEACDTSIYLVIKSKYLNLSCLASFYKIQWLVSQYINRNAEIETITGQTLREGENGQLLPYFHWFLHFCICMDEWLDGGWQSIFSATAGTIAATENQLRKTTVFSLNSRWIVSQYWMQHLHSSLFLTINFIENLFNFINRESWKKRFLD